MFFPLRFKILLSILYLPLSTIPLSLLVFSEEFVFLLLITVKKICKAKIVNPLITDTTRKREKIPFINYFDNTITLSVNFKGRHFPLFLEILIYHLSDYKCYILINN